MLVFQKARSLRSLTHLNSQSCFEKLLIPQLLNHLPGEESPSVLLDARRGNGLLLFVLVNVEFVPDVGLLSGAHEFLEKCFLWWWI
jgi:hypothetical protein